MNERTEKLRWSILDHARTFGNDNPGKWVTGSKLAITARDHRNEPVADEAHAAELLAWLCGQGLLEEQSASAFGDPSSELRHRRFRLTDLGFKLWAKQIDPIPGVWDRRIA